MKESKEQSTEEWMADWYNRRLIECVVGRTMVIPVRGVYIWYLSERFWLFFLRKSGETGKE